MRKTYCEVNLVNLQNNVKKLINNFSNYFYYFGVVKADCYGHGDINSIQAIIDGGCNYLAVATMKEALFIREHYKDIPILFLGVATSEDIELCINNNITISICYIDQVNDFIDCDLSGLKVHIKINSGMNRLGISNVDEVNKVISMLSNRVNVEGIYSHIYEASSEKLYLQQVNMFENIINNIDYSFDIVHIAASEALVNYPKPYFVNGCRLGIIMYGFSDKINLLSTFRVVSEVVQINTLNKGDVVGYNGIYTASCDGEKIAVIPIGYADGIIRKNTGRYVYINNKKYRIVGNICMDMLFVKVDDDVKLFDKVDILRDNEHINDVSCHLETIPYEVMCSISKRVERVYIL